MGIGAIARYLLLLLVCKDHIFTVVRVNTVHVCDMSDKYLSRGVRERENQLSFMCGLQWVIIEREREKEKCSSEAIGVGKRGDGKMINKRYSFIYDDIVGCQIALKV